MLPFCHCLSFCQNYIKIALPQVSSSFSQGCLFFVSLVLKTPKRKKKSIPERINFLIKKSLKNHTFGSSERLPPLSGVLPTNNSTHPPIRKPPPSQELNFCWLPFCHCFLFGKKYIKIALTQASSSSSEGCLFFSSLFLKTPKRKKKSIPERINFLIKKSLKNHTFGSSERLPPLSGVLPTNNSTHPPIRKPPPSQELNFCWLPFCH